MSGIVKNVIVLAGLVLLGVLGYYLFIMNDDSVIRVDNAQVALRAEAETQEFLRRLNELKTVELSDSLFADPRFDSLVNYAKEPTPQAIGRSNPFETTF